MKKLLVVFAAVSLTLFPQTTLIAGVNAPVTKKLVAEITLPDKTVVPAKGDVLAFQCGARSYVVVQSPVQGGYQGQTVSKLYAFNPNGTPTRANGQTYAYDSDTSIVRFTGTCVGDRAVMTNHWEDALHRVAGDMMTSVTGEEGTGPLWQVDEKTAHYWYSTSNVPGGLTAKVYPFHQVSVQATHASITGTVVKYGDVLYGSSMNMILGTDGKAYSEYAPWFADFSKMVVPQGMQFEARFFRTNNNWLMMERDVPADPSALVKETAVHYWMREDTAKVWHEVSASIFSNALQDGVEQKSQFSSVGSTLILQDGLYHRTVTRKDTGEISLGTPTRIHVASSNDLHSAPRVYMETEAFGMVPQTFTYVIRTGENKLQVWQATAK